MWMSWRRGIDVDYGKINENEKMCIHWRFFFFFGYIVI
jgi:hypothetical protein